MTEALWRPSAERVANANLTRFIACVNARLGTRLDTFASLYDWSIREPGQFWVELARFADIRAQWGSGPVLTHPERMPGARFFADSRLNFAENLLRYRDARPALVFRNEREARRELSFAQLHTEVARVAAWLAAHGVGRGDRVAAILPNLPETCIAMLASASLGAVWSSCSPDFGAPALLDRLGQICPKVLFCTDGYFYAGKSIESLPTVAAVLAQLPGIEHVVVVPYRSATPALGGLPNAVRFDELPSATSALAFVRTEFNDPLYILYSSGTTGIPKCIVHGAGGTLLQHQKEHLLHTDLSRADRLFYFTTCGWMMWNWLMSGLAVGSTLVLYDGSPVHPDPGALWRMAQEERITIFGTSAKYLAGVQRSRFNPAREVDLSCVRTILSTGSPLPPESFASVYRDVKSDVQLCSISGGTDIVSCFALGCPLLPVYPGEIQSRGLGMRVEIFDEQGNAVRGRKGELVCSAPFPSMPVGFLNDADGGRYRAAYFERFPNVWHHGDYAELTEHDGIIIFGRSDAVLNPGGVRIGTAEIYAAVETLPQVLESLAVAQDWRNDVRVVLFVRLQPGIELDDSLTRRIRDTIRSRATARHVPAKILAVPDLPRTLSGKLTELAVRAVIHGQPVHNIDALANPGALEYFRDRPELQS
jgi:acetoacetyl-CoA synthetase